MLPVGASLDRLPVTFWRLETELPRPVPEPAPCDDSSLARVPLVIQDGMIESDRATSVAAARGLVAPAGDRQQLAGGGPCFFRRGVLGYTAQVSVFPDSVAATAEVPTVG